MLDSRVNKLIMFLFSVGALVAFFSVKPNQRLDTLSIDKPAYESIKSAKTQTQADLIDEIKFDEYPLIFDKAAGTFYYSMIQNRKDAQNPVYEIISSTSVHIAFSSLEISEESIRNNTRHSFIAYSDEYYKEYTLVVTHVADCSCRAR